MKSVCVFCGSSPGASPEYREAAGRVGRLLAGRGIALVYGGASVGLMGAVADAALTAGGQVVGVLPAVLADKEIAHRGLSELRLVGSMHERKALMAGLSDGFLVLPGGMGTLDETAEILTWGQLGLHDKPVGLLDVRGFWAGLLSFLDHAVAERFLRPQHRAAVLCDGDPERLLDRMAAWRPQRTDKWLDRGPA
jgi:uncharacterized protein (TIGR00730 family)